MPMARCCCRCCCCLQEVSGDTPDDLFGMPAHSLVGQNISAFVDVFMVGALWGGQRQHGSSCGMCHRGTGLKAEGGQEGRVGGACSPALMCTPLRTPCRAACI